MTFALTFGLLAALLWGATDFFIRIAGRRLGIHRSMLYAQATGALSMGLWLVCSPSDWQVAHDARSGAWIAAIVAALTGFIATCALYRGMQVGRVGVVAPIAGAYGAVTAILSWATGEPVTYPAMIGIGIIIAGAVLVSEAAPEEHTPQSGASSEKSGVPWAVLSGVGFGAGFWVQGRFAAPQLGAVLPVGVYYGISTSLLLVAALVLRPALKLNWQDAKVVTGTGTVAVLGFVALSLGLTTGHIALVTALSSLQSAVTVGLAGLFAGERLSTRQWVGVAAVVIGLAVVRLS